MPAAVDTNVLLPVLRGDAASATVLVPFLLLTYNAADFGRVFPDLEVVIPPTGDAQ
jgi:hypothetical protein